MDASKTSWKTENLPPEKGTAGPQLPFRRWLAKGISRRRRIAGTGVLLAMALAVPVGVHLNGDHGSRPAPEADRKTGPVEPAEALQQAARSGKDVPVTAWHTANSTTWAQPDGNLRTRTYSDTIRAHVGGEWKKVDTTLRRVEGGYAPKAVNDPLLFNAGGGQDEDSRASRAVSRRQLAADSGASAAGEEWTELVRLTTGGHDVVVSWPGPLPAPVVEGPRALYKNVRPDIDLLLTARDSGFSHVLIVHTREAAEDPLLSQLQYLLESASLEFELDEPSSAVSAKDSDGTEMAASPTPYMWDSAGKPAATIGETTSAPDPEVADPALSLPGLAGPQPGTHATPLDADLAADGTLAVSVNKRTLTDPDMVYPVFIDPSFKGRKRNWTLLYESARNSSFWNGQNFNDGTNEARVGFETTTDGLSRSMFTFEFGAALHGASIKSATFRALQTYSWGCASRAYYIYLTGAITSSTTWANQPGELDRLGTGTNGHGYRSDTCPDKWVAHDIKRAAERGSRDRLETLTFGLKAADEQDTYAWKKFLANGESAPYIEVVFNNPPNEPSASAMKMVPGSSCDTTSPNPGVGKTDVTFTITGSDRDGNLKYINLFIWPGGDSAHPVRKANYAVNSTGTVNVLVPWESFTHGTTYIWTARAIDTEGAASAWGPTGTNAYCRFTVDHNAPNSPTVSSDVYPSAGDDGATWSTVRFGTSGQFTFSPNGSSDVKEYQYGFNTAFNLTASPNPANYGRAVVSLKPPHAGPSVLYVRSVDSTGNVSRSTNYIFNVRPSPVLDGPGDVTGDTVPDVYTITPEGNLDLYANAEGTDRLHFPMAAAYTTAGGTAQPLPDGYWTGALITHNGDWLPGDGIQDLVARMPDGSLYMYPGDGYGGFNVSERREVLMPSGAPDPASIRQILSVGDIAGDRRPELLAISGADLWAFSGYTGGSFAKATHLTGEDWSQRDLVQVGHIAGDSSPDLVFREESAGQLWLRYGKTASGGGVDLGSFATEADAAGQLNTYGISGWSRSALPVVTGVPDLTGDGLPEVWALFANGDVRVYPGRAARLTSSEAFYVVSSTVGTSWAGHTAIG
jgi:hypothetical protein